MVPHIWGSCVRFRDPHQRENRIRVRINFKSLIRIRIRIRSAVDAHNAGVEPENGVMVVADSNQFDEDQDPDPHHSR